MSRPPVIDRNVVRTCVLMDIPAKAIATTWRFSTHHVYKIINELGFRMMYVTAEERQHLITRRHNLAQQNRAA